MGCFSVACGATGISMMGDEDVFLLPLVVGKYPQTKLADGINVVCNEGTWMNYVPMTLPIRGKLDDYGRVHSIKKDKNTSIIERLWGLPINDFASMVCDKNLEEEQEKQKQLILDKIQEKEDLDIIKPDTSEQHRKIIEATNKLANEINEASNNRRLIAGMVVNAAAWTAFSRINTLAKYFFPGNAKTLEFLGFKNSGETTDKRYNQKMTLPGSDVEIWSDGRYYHFAREGKMFDQIHSDWTSKELAKKGVKIPKAVLEVAKKLPQTFDRVLELEENFKRFKSHSLVLSDMTMYDPIFGKLIQWYGDEIFQPDLRLDFAKLMAFGYNMSSVNRIVGPTWSGTQCGEFREHRKLLKITEKLLTKAIKKRW